MQSNLNTRPENQLQDRISRIAEGVLLLGGALICAWLLVVIGVSFMK